MLPLAMLLVGSRVDLRCTWVVFGGSAIFQVLVCLEPWTFPRVAHVRPIFTQNRHEVVWSIHLIET